MINNAVSTDPFIQRLVKLALEEDCASNDITSKLCIDPTQQSSAYLLGKEDGIFCGNLLIPVIIDAFSKEAGQIPTIFSIILEDGQPFKANTKLAAFAGSTVSLLSLERTILNFVQRLCGIATLTSRFVAVAGKNTILDTRKSVPGHRSLDKYAVRAGGGKNHRMNLADMILVKNNHIDGVRSDFTKLNKLISGNPNIPVEVEVRNNTELENVLNFLSPNVIMLDNYSDSDIPSAVNRIRNINSNIQIELSGSMTIDRVAKLSQLVEGVLISVGGLFTKVHNIDISMRIEPNK